MNFLANDREFAVPKIHSVVVSHFTNITARLSQREFMYSKTEPSCCSQGSSTGHTSFRHRKPHADDVKKKSGLNIVN